MKPYLVHHLVNVRIIHYKSLRYICLLHRPNRQAEWGCDGNHHSCIFQVLDDGINLCNQSGNALQLLVYCFLRKGSYNNFRLALPTIIALTPHVREPIWRSSQLLSISVPMIYSRTGEIILSHWACCETALCKNSIANLTSISFLLCLKALSDTLGLLELVSV